MAHLITIPVLRAADPHRNGDNTGRRTCGSSAVADIPRRVSVFLHQTETDIDSSRGDRNSTHDFSRGLVNSGNIDLSGGEGAR